MGFRTGKTRALIAGIMMLLATAAAVAQEDRWNEVTIRATDVPRDAPGFDSYRSSAYSGPNASLRLTSNAADQMYRTRIRDWSKSKANFAGHYILATWGCGTDCLQITIIDAKTGEVFHPFGVGSIASMNVDDALLAGSPAWPNEGAAKFEVNSRLLVLIGMPEEDVKRRGISYYVWQDDKLRRVRFVPKTWYR